jgi:hypothetical protein
LKILVIPDAQVKPGHPVDYLRRIGEFIVDKKPDVIVNIGDFADMPSLSSYDRGTKAFEGRRYKADVEAVHAGMDALLGPLNDYNRKAAKGHRERYNPRRILTLGNHEYRIVRATNEDPKLDGTIGLEDLKYQAYGWEVYYCLQPLFCYWRGWAACWHCGCSITEDQHVLCRWASAR